MLFLVEEQFYRAQKHSAHIVEKSSMRTILAAMIKQPDDSILNELL